MSEETEPIPGLLPPDPRVLSANQLVSYNLMRARRAVGWSQQDVANLLEQLTGRSWSNASVSAAERAWQGGRPRRFDACEILAMSTIFNEPIGFFFLPPGPDEYSAEHVGTREFPDGKPDLHKNDDLLAAIPTRNYVSLIALAHSTPSFTMRIQELCAKWMSVSWSKPEVSNLGKPLYFDGSEDVDWAEVEQSAEAAREQRSEEVERALSAEHRDAFLRKHADDMAMLIAENLARMGLRRDNGSPKTDWGNHTEDPPF
ncbi:hypothetical protein QBA35_19160 [Streptomyces bottropensis]|uniref:HTH cro/C1-type domain-containing protein n=1 Tax=Streptomyces bottropensis TaxID=42235 RepID=A0ABU8AQ69_9ACTN